MGRKSTGEVRPRGVRAGETAEQKSEDQRAHPLRQCQDTKQRSLCSALWIAAEILETSMLIVKQADLCNKTQ